jgi:citrate synthase
MTTAHEQQSATIRELERRRFAAMTAADVDTLADLLADDLIYTHSDASRDDKASYLARVADGTFGYGRIDHVEHEVVVHEDTVLVIGEMRTRAVVRGVPRPIHNRGLSVWVRNADRWELTAYHPTPVLARRPADSPAQTSSTTSHRATTAIGHSTADTILVQGYNLTDELMGEIDFGGVFFLLITGRLPVDGEARLFNAILVALADHGLTPTALAARLTYTGAPDAVQGAIAAGILGAGSVFLGVFEDAGTMLRAAAPDPGATGDEIARTAAELVAGRRERGQRIPGLGHPLHKQGDPRTTRLLQIARDVGPLGVHTRLMLAVEAAAASSSEVPLPLNAGGLSGALLCDLGVDTAILHGVAVVSRAAGIAGHLAEEAHAPMGRLLWDLAERETSYQSGRTPG